MRVLDAPRGQTMCNRTPCTGPMRDFDIQQALRRRILAVHGVSRHQSRSGKAHSRGIARFAVVNGAIDGFDQSDVDRGFTGSARGWRLMAKVFDQWFYSYDVKAPRNTGLRFEVVVPVAGHSI